MDVAFFFRERTRFIRFYYAKAAQPFTDTKRQIEDGEPPFDDPPYAEDDEPPFMAEWSDADTALVLTGRSCVSMLSASLKLYFDAWEKELGVCWENNEKSRAWKRGFERGYLTELCGALGITLDDCPADLAVIEQVFLARNRDQHPESIHTMKVKHGKRDIAKHPSPFFATDHEKAMHGEAGLERVDWLNPSVHFDADMLQRVIAKSEALVNWLEPQFFAVKYPDSAGPKD